MYRFIERAVWGNNKMRKKRLADPAADLLCLMALTLITTVLTIISLSVPHLHL